MPTCLYQYLIMKVYPQQQLVAVAWDQPTPNPSLLTIPMGLYHSKRSMGALRSFQNQMTLHSPSSSMALPSQPTLSKLPALAPLTTTLTITIPSLIPCITVNITILPIGYWLGLLVVEVMALLWVGGVESRDTVLHLAPTLVTEQIHNITHQW